MAKMKAMDLVKPAVQGAAAWLLPLYAMNVDAIANLMNNQILGFQVLEVAGTSIKVGMVVLAGLGVWLAGMAFDKK